MMCHRLNGFIAAVMVGTLLGACASPSNSPGNTAMTKTAAPPPSQPQAPTTTYCLGRFLINMPAGSTLSGGTYKYDFGQIEKPVAVSLEQFKKELQAREEKLRSIKHDKEPSLLRGVEQPTSNTRILAFFKEPYISSGIEIEGYKWIDGTRFFVKAQADDDRQPRAMIGMVNRLVPLRPRADTDIPQDPGYCFGGGFIANEKWENEEASIDVDIAGHPDAFVTVTILPLATRKKDKPLLDRMGGAVQQLGKFATGVQLLRKGERNIGPIKGGQEYLVTVPNSGGLRAHSFIWETQGEGTLQDPFISIELATGHQDDKGNPQQTRLTDEQAIKLWDKIVSSFRLRPVSAKPVKTSDAAPPDNFLGELAATGRTCPRTGLWECTETSAAIEGGNQQFLKAGDLMPHVVLQGEPTLWQKLKGETPTYRSATMWKLVGYESPGEPSKPSNDTR
jgi:Tle cognate immunity protein 4 C-terminal domain/Tle cognate immunity protein 4 N-terminal domain